VVEKVVQVLREVLQLMVLEVAVVMLPMPEVLEVHTETMGLPQLIMECLTEEVVEQEVMLVVQLEEQEVVIITEQVVMN
jgi:hypothetical protein